jgi:hypothetical protein
MPDEKELTRRSAGAACRKESKHMGTALILVAMDDVILKQKCWEVEMKELWLD